MFSNSDEYSNCDQDKKQDGTNNLTGLNLFILLHTTEMFSSISNDTFKVKYKERAVADWAPTVIY